MPAGHEGGNQQGRHGRSSCGPAPLERRQPAAAGGNAMLNTAPDFGAIFWAEIGNGQRVNCVQYTLQGAVKVAAAGALFQVLFGGESIAFLAVVMQNKLFFSQVIHVATLFKLRGRLIGRRWSRWSASLVRGQPPVGLPGIASG